MRLARIGGGKSADYLKYIYILIYTCIKTYFEQKTEFSVTFNSYRQTDDLIVTVTENMYNIFHVPENFFRHSGMLFGSYVR